ncbi:RidA family protein [Chloroflexota bacterium]
MELKRHNLFYGGKLMPFSKGTSVKGAKGFIWLSGTEGRDPESHDVKLASDGVYIDTEVVKGAEAQALMSWGKIKSRLEDMGSSLDNIIKIISYVVGPFPDGVANSPIWTTAYRVREEFFNQHCPDLCSAKNPPTHDLIGVAALAHKEMLIEIAVVAAIPD